MHELAITESIVSGLSERFEGMRIRRVVLELGQLTAVVPEAIRFCFDVCAEGTPLEGAALEIVRVPARIRCRTCAAESEMEGPLPGCPCGSNDVSVIAGEEMLIRAVEVV